MLTGQPAASRRYNLFSRNMLEFYSTTEVIWLGKELGRGGEGAVFEIIDKPDVVAKIYHDPVSDDKAEKLRQMVVLKSEKLLRLTAWVTDVLRDQPIHGRTVGFLMPKINFGTAIHELYNPQSRRQHFPAADWRFLIHAAANLARAFAVIHSHNHAVGDVNHGNVVIGRDATVRLIDCDSYHLNAPEKSYLCEVGVSTHTPPELQNQSLRSVARTANHDAFGLAVLIFQLLFMGRHPFSGTYQGADENTLENSIQNQRFAYGEGAAKRLIKQPPGTLPLSAISSKLAQLFESAFLEIENRPTAREWIDALEELEQNLQQCAINNGHYYLQTLKKCPWCKLEGQTGVLFFPAKFTGNFESNGEFDLFTLGNLIDAVKPPDLPQSLPLVTQNLLVPATKLPPSLTVTNALASYNRNLAVFLVVTTILIFLVSYSVGFGSMFWMGFVGIWVMNEVLKSLLKIPQEDTQQAVDTARQNWQNFKEEWRATTLAKPFETAREQLKVKIKEYKELPRQKEAKLKVIESDDYQLQLKFYLQKYLIKDAELSGLSDERIDLLTKSGIRTAAQIDANNFPRISEFHYPHKQILFDWRSKLEKKFVFKQSPKLIEEFTGKVENEIRARSSQLEIEIRGGLIELQQVSLQLTKRHEDLSSQSDKFAIDLSQAESDFERVSNLKTKAIAWMICVALISFIVGICVRQLHYTGFYLVSQSEIHLGSSPATVRGTQSKTSLSSESIKNLQSSVIPEDSLAKWGKAGALYQFGEKCFNRGDYQLAISAYTSAARANPKIAAIHNKMGDTYVHLAQYAKAAESYQESLKIDPKDSNAWHNLGMAYQKINSINEAIEAFKKAIENNANIEASYLELGLCYVHINSSRLAMRQSDLLDEMNSPLAEKLRLAIKNADSPMPFALNAPNNSQKSDGSTDY